MLKVICVRHGESQGNYFLEKRYISANKTHEIICGHNLDSELTDVGKKQAEMLGLYWEKKGFKPDLIFSSTAKRAIDTAKIVTNILMDTCPKILESPDLLEIDQGDYVGKIREVYSEEMQKIIDKDPWNFKAPNGESQKDVELRMVSFLDQNIIKNWDGKTNTSVVLFGHGVAFKCLFRALIDSNPEQYVILHITNFFKVHGKFQ
jgi:broad specificity phosphatase PhoE